MILREHSSDFAVFNSVFNKNEYGIDFLQESDIIVDVGGHIGSFSLLAYEKGSRNIYSYESNSSNFAVLYYNIKDTNITAFNKAVRGDYIHTQVGSRFGKAMSEMPVKNYGGICISEGVDVDVITLEDIVLQLGKIKILKLDCEGSEYSIVFSSPDYIFEKIDCIVGELHGCNIPINRINGESKTHEDFIERLKNLGYSVKYKRVSETSSLGKFTATK